jgi:hypothetical protein
VPTREQWNEMCHETTVYYLHVFAAFDDNGGGRDGKQTGPNTDKTKNLEVVTSSTVFRIPDSVITVRD